VESEGNEFPVADVRRMFNELKEELNNSMNPKSTWTNELEKTQKQLNYLKEDFNKLQNETKKIIKKREINEIKKTAKDMKEEFNKEIERLRKK
jgi:chromosome segregation ATPase